MLNILLNLLCLLGIIVVGVVFIAVLAIGKLIQIAKGDKDDGGGTK